MIVANKVGETGRLLEGGLSGADACPGSWDPMEEKGRNCPSIRNSICKGMNGEKTLLSDA